MINTEQSLDSQKLNKKREKLPRYAHADEMYTGPEPKWESRPLDTEEDERVRFIGCLNWYSHYFESKEAKKFLVDYLKSTKTKKNQLEEVSACTVGCFPNAVGWIARMLSNGAEDLPDGCLKHLKRGITTASQSGRKNLIKLKETEQVKAQKKAKKKKTPEQLEQEFYSEVAGELEGKLDEFIDNKYRLDEFDPEEFLKAKKVPSAVATRLAKLFVPRTKELQSKDPQTVEAYSHMKKAQIKRLSDFYSSITSAATKWSKNAEAKKIQLVEPKKPRKQRICKPRKKNPLKMVKRLKYLREEKKLKLHSIDPVKIVGAEQLWVFNTNNRKLMRFLASDASGLSVKGSTILNYDEDSSEQRMLRKPKEVLAELMSTGKVGLKHLMEDLTTRPSKLTGRVNKHCVLMRVL